MYKLEYVRIGQISIEPTQIETPFIYEDGLNDAATPLFFSAPG